ncbi:MFS transporter [Bradyrhizobium sp.]
MSSKFDDRVESASVPLGTNSRQAAGSGLAPWILLLIVFIDALSYAMVLALLPFAFGDEAKAPTVGGLLVGLQALLAALSAPSLGRLSDRLGRNWVIAATLLGLSVSYGLLAASQTLTGLALSRVLAGAMAGNLGVIQAALTAPVTGDRRVQRLGRLNAAWLGGFVAGPGCVALILELGGSPVPWIAGSAAIMALVLGLGVGSVALGGRIDAADSTKTVAPAAPSPTQVRAGVWLSLLVVIALCQTGLATVLGYWAVATLGWDQTEVSLWRLWTSAWVLAVSIWATRPLARRLGNVGLVIASLSVAGGSALIFAAPIGAAAPILGAPLVYAAVFVGLSGANAALADLAAPGRLGALMGRAQSSAASGRVIGPALFSWMLEKLWPAAPFMLIVALMGAGLFLILRSSRGGNTDGVACSAGELKP